MPMGTDKRMVTLMATKNTKTETVEELKTKHEKKETAVEPALKTKPVEKETKTELLTPEKAATHEKKETLPEAEQKAKPVEKEAKTPEKKAEQKEPEQLTSEQKEEKAAAAKKWKGKDWFSIVAPPLFDSKVLAETPSTDPENLAGRNIEVNVADVTGQANKFHMNISFRLVGELEGKSIRTRFNGFSVIRDHVYRFVRKNSLKLNIYTNVETKDGWRLQLSTVTILNKNTNAALGRGVRHLMAEMLVETAKKEPLDQLIKAVISGGLQKSMRMAGTKIYPVRFCEIERIEVLGEPAQTAPMAKAG